jgi:hypothetical protein
MRLALLLVSVFLLTPPIPAPSETICGGSTSGCVVYKTPYELKLLSMDFTQPFGSDPFTIDAIVVAKNSDTNQDSTSSLIATVPVPAIVPDTEKVVFAVTGGNKGETHIVGVRAIDTSTGQKLEGQFTVVVK